MDKVQVMKVLALQATEVGKTSIYDAFQDVKGLPAEIITFNDYAVYRGIPEREFFIGNQTQLDHLFEFVNEEYFGKFVELTLVIYSPVNLSRDFEINGIVNVLCLNLNESCQLAIEMAKATGGAFLFSENLGKLEKNLNFLLSYFD